jgi:disulfide oxidoreductase YuzD
VRDEIQRRFADQVIVTYHNLDEEAVRTEYASIISDIDARGLLYPVTVVDSVPVYDGAVSYPAIMRVVTNKIAELQATEG